MPLWIIIGVAAAIFVLVIVVAASCNLFSSDAAEESAAKREILPGNFTVGDIERVTFRPAFRGYRMEEVDEAMLRLRNRIHDLELDVEEFRAERSSGTVQHEDPAAP